jgi:hypothetical protein
MLSTVTARQGWTLCIGSGISRGAFPDWPTLVARLIDRVSGTVNGPHVARLLRSATLDGLIEGAKDVLNVDRDTFAQVLSEELYRDLRAASGAHWGDVVEALMHATPQTIAVDKWQSLKWIMDSLPQKPSAGSISRVLASVVETDKAPKAVISFNTESLLLALTRGELNFRGNRRRVFCPMTSLLSVRTAKGIPYIFCHGLLSPPGAALPHPNIVRPGVDKLVFSESEYSQVANSVFSWQSASFLSFATQSSMVFVGLSFSDPNLRRWLAWTHSNRLADLNANGFQGASTAHYWIKQKTSDQREMRWIEAYVAHLGVQLIWIDTWDDAGDCLKRMLF